MNLIHDSSGENESAFNIVNVNKNVQQSTAYFVIGGSHKVCASDCSMFWSIL
jgi:hypothetical protein